MPVNDSGVWVPNLCEAQMRVFNSQKRVLLVSGPRWSGKTIAVVHKICRHLWETPGARVALFSKTIKSAKDGGVWDDLTTIAIPEWIDANLEGINPEVHFEYVKEPGNDGQTRTLHFKIRNYYGGVSELKLFSLDFDDEVEAKVKGTRFSMIWFSELTNFNTRKVLTVTKQQLRMLHLRPSQHQWIADTNPSEEGQRSWIWQLFYKERTMDPNEIEDPRQRKSLQIMQPQLGLEEIMLDDNPFLDGEKKEEIKADYAFDPDLYARNVEGKWVEGIGAKGKVFADAFKENIHVVGDTSGAEDDWEVAVPSDNCFELIGGWDLGDANHAFCILEKRLVGERAYWTLLDEVVVVGEQVSLVDFTELAMEKIKFHEDYLKAWKNREVKWRHWSDDSSTTRYRSAIDDIDSSVVRRVSNGRIELLGVDKREVATIRRRVSLTRRLLMEQRLSVSATCPASIEMFKRLSHGTNKAEYIRNDEHKHPFDALTYPILMESAYDERDSLDNRVKTSKKTPQLISVALA